MGQHESLPLSEITEIFEESPTQFEHWSTPQSTDLHKLYVAQNLDFGISPDEFERLVADSVPTGRVASHRLLKIFDKEESGMIDVLEALCGITVASKTASITEKIGSIFTYFDFDSTGTVTYDELFILIFSSLRSMQKILGKGHEPEDSDCERIVDEIYLKAGKEPPSAVVALGDIVEWVNYELNLGSEKGKVSKMRGASDEA